MIHWAWKASICDRRCIMLPTDPPLAGVRCVAPETYSCIRYPPPPPAERSGAARPQELESSLYTSDPSARAASDSYCDREALGPSAYLRGCAPASPTTHHFLCGFHSIRAPRTVPLCTHAIRIAQPAGGDQGGSMRYSGHRCSSCPRRGLAERSSRPRAPRPDHMPPHPSAFAWHPYTSSTPPVHLQGSGATAAVGRRWVARGTMRIRTQPLDPPTPRSHYLSRAPCVRSWGDARRARPSATRALNRTRARVLCRVTARHSDAGKSGGAL